MRKWTYLVAALLMSGTAATFTSCIDTTEPAGIEELRGAKADFIRAKADYERALVALQNVKVDREKVKLELDKITLEVEQLKLEIEKLEHENDKREVQLKLEVLEKAYEKQILGLDKEIAIAKKDLLEALNSLKLAELYDRDQKFGEKISGLRATISELISQMTDEEDILKGLQISKMQFIAENKYYGAGLELQKVTKEKNLEILENLVINYKELKTTDKEDLNKQLANIKNQKEALKEKEKKAWEDYQALKNGKEYVDANKAVQDLIIKEEEESSFTLPMDKVNAGIQEDLYSALTVSGTPYVTTEIDKVFNSAHDAMTADLVLDKNLLTPVTPATEGSLQYKDLADKMEELADIILAKGQENYADEYNRLFSGATLTADDIFNEDDNTVLQSILTKVEAEKNRIAKDKEIYKTNYENALNAWIDSYIAFHGALDSYGGYKNAQPIIDIRKKIDGIEKLYDDKIADGTDITTAEAKSWRNQIVGFYNLRNNVDGVLETQFATFSDTYVKIPVTGDDPIDGAAVGAGLNSLVQNFIALAESDFAGANDDLVLSAAYNSSYKGVSTYKQLVNAYVSLFETATSVGFNPIELGEIIEPVLNNGAKPANPEDAIPADINIENVETGSIYLTYQTSINFDLVYPEFKNYANWKATYDYIAAEQAKVKEATDKLTADKDAKIAEYEELYIKLWTTELEGFLINGTKNGTEHADPLYPDNYWFSDSNPYIDFVDGGDISTGTAVPFDNRTEFAALQAQENLIQSAIDNGGDIYFVKYDPDTQEFSVTDGTETLDYLITDTEDKINEIEGEISDLEFQIAQFNENGFDGIETIDDYDRDIKESEDKLKLLQDDLDMYNAYLKKLLDAYAAE